MSPFSVTTLPVLSNPISALIYVVYVVEKDFGPVIKLAAIFYSYIHFA